MDPTPTPHDPEPETPTKPIRPPRWRVNVNFQSSMGMLGAIVFVLLSAALPDGMPEPAWGLAGAAVTGCFMMAKDMLNKKEQGMDD